jgi:nifR3 family TIM-barrel protein
MFFLKNKVGLAPLADYSDYPFRTIAREFGADFTFTEMISSDALAQNIKKTYKYLPREDEKNVGIQLFGHEPKNFSDSAKFLRDKAEWIDINAGCPVKKVVRRGAGAALLKDLDRFKEIIYAVKSQVEVPVGIKIRIGYEENNVYKIVNSLKESQPDYIIIHGRTREEFYTGQARKDFFKDIEYSPLGASGDIFTQEDIDYYFKEQNVDFVVVARGAIGNPWIFCNKNPTIDEIYHTTLKHLSLIVKEYEELKAVNKFKKFLVAYTKGIYGAKEQRKNLSSLKREKDVIEYIDELLKK